MDTQTIPLQASDLTYFTGSEHWYTHPLIRSITYTDGVKYVADKAGAYWLIDEVATNQLDRKISAEEFQVWKLVVNREKSTAVLTCEDGDYNEVFRKDIDFTDFPLPEITLWYTNRTILLPSEY